MERVHFWDWEIEPYPFYPFSEPSENGEESFSGLGNRARHTCREVDAVNALSLGLVGVRVRVRG